MPLPVDYRSILERLALVFTSYRERTSGPAILVGGAAVAIYTAGEFMSGDFDVVAAANEVFEAAMADNGFRCEDRTGHLFVGFYHPEHPGYGVQLVSGAPFYGRSDLTRLVQIIVKPPGIITMPPIEDMIADRLAQYSIASPTDESRLLQARALIRLAGSLDNEYLLKRIQDEGGDPTLIEHGPGLGAAT